MNMQSTQSLEQAALEGSYVRSSVAWAQLKSGSFNVRYGVVAAPPLQLSLRSYNLAFQAEAKVEPNKALVALTAHPHTQARWFGTDVDAATIIVSASSIDVRTNGPSSFFAVTIDKDALQARLPSSPDASDLFDSLDYCGVARHRLEAARLRAGLRLAFARRPMPPPLINGTLVPLLASALGNFHDNVVERSKCLNRRFAAVRSCEAYMREHVDATLTLLDLSQVVGMRSRSLINAFEAITGLSPMDYLKRLRLNGAHRALGGAHKQRTRVIDVATAWGFWHMGHFSADYRTMFGEAPSETLLASQRHFAVG